MFFEVKLISSIRPVLMYDAFKKFKIIYQSQKKLSHMGKKDFLWQISVQVEGDIEEFEKILCDNYEIMELIKNEKGIIPQAIRHAL